MFNVQQVRLCFPNTNCVFVCVRKQTVTDGIILHKLLKLNPLFSYKRFIFKQKLSRQRQIGYGKIANISIMGPLVKAKATVVKTFAVQYTVYF